MAAPRPTPVLIWSSTISVLVVLASVRGLVDAATYGEETANWATQAKGQDIGNLLAVLTLVVSGYGSHQGSHRAALVWLGTLLYLIYAYLVYAMAVHFGRLFLVYVAVLGLSFYALVSSLDRARADDRRHDPRARLHAGCTAIAIGVLFGLLWLGELVPATLSGDAPRSVVEAGLWVNPIHVVDLALLLPGFVVAGVLALRGSAAGQFLLGPLLVFSVLMGSSIVAAMLLLLADGSGDALPPLVMVSAVVVASLVAARRYLGSYAGRPPGAPLPATRTRSTLSA